MCAGLRNLVHAGDKLVVGFDDGLVSVGLDFEIGLDLGEVVLNLSKLADAIAVLASERFVLGF